MNNEINFKEEWTQKELLEKKKELEKEGIKVLLIDTILKPIEGIETFKYNPFEMKNMPLKTVFVFYCDTGKTTKERLNFYKSKFPEHKCVSLRGGRAYWRPNFQLFDKVK